MVAVLDIHALRGEHRVERTSTGRRLAAEVQWLVEGTSAQLEEIAAALPSRLRRRVGPALVLRFGNAVGVFDLPHLGRLEVHSRKWGERHFESMLAEITARMAALPFAPGTGTHLPYDRALGHDERILLHTFMYLRHMCSAHAAPEDQVAPALRLITGAPHRRLERTSRWTPLALARRGDPRGLVRVFAPRAGLEPVPAGTGGAFAQALRGHLPQRVDESIVGQSVDTPPNRFAKAFLDQMLGIVERVRALANQRREHDFLRRRLLLECDEIERALAPARRHSVWTTVGPMHRLPVESTVLARRRGYRELFTQFLRLRMAARLPFSPERVAQLLEIKDIAALYELWVFFAVEQAVSSQLGRGPDRAAVPRVDQLQARLPWDLCVSWGTIELFYNLRFSRSRKQRRSYSLALRPDVVLSVPEGPNAGLHLFDAKFRLDQIRGLRPEEDDLDRDEADEQIGKFKHADVYKMHTYRDALPEARSVWVMYPGSLFRMYEVGETGRLVTDVETLGSLVEGVGGVPARPGETCSELAGVIRAVLPGVSRPSTTTGSRGLGTGPS